MLMTNYYKQKWHAKQPILFFLTLLGGPQGPANPKAQTRPLIHQKREGGKKRRKKPDLRVDAFHLCTEQEWGQAEKAHQSTRTLLQLLQSKGLWVILQRLLMLLRSVCLNSCAGEEILSMCIPARRHAPSAGHYSSFIYFGHRIYASPPGRWDAARPQTHQPRFPLCYLMSGQRQLCDG